MARRRAANALNPVITMLGLQFGWLLGSTILVEVVFSWPGLGLYAYNAFRTFDYNPILAITIVMTVAFVLVNELVELSTRSSTRACGSSDDRGPRRAGGGPGSPTPSGSAAAKRDRGRGLSP